MRAVGENLPQLEKLWISKCSRVTARGVRHVARGCPRMIEFVAEGLPLLADEGERVSTPMLTETEDVTNQGQDGIVALAAMCLRLKRVDLSNCTNIGDRSLLALSSGSRSEHFSPLSSTQEAGCHLLEINVRGCSRFVTSAGVRAILSSCRQLESLDLSECMRIGDDAFVLDKHPLSIQTLRLGGCPNVSDSTLQTVGRRTQLRNLDLSGCALISDFGILALLDPSEPQHALPPKSKDNRSHQRRQVLLQKIWLRGLPLVTDTSIAWLAVYCPRLILLDITRCASIMDVSLIALAGNWKLGELKMANQYRGIAPIDRASDWLILEDYGDCWRAATRIQSLFRAQQARKRAAVLREEALTHWVALRLQSAYRGRQARKLTVLRRLQHQKETDAAMRVQTRFRERRKLRVMKEKRRVEREIARQKAARTVQLAYRFCKLRARLYHARERLRLTHELQEYSSTIIQRMWRGHYVRKHVLPEVRAMHSARALRECKAVVTLQTRFRARLARKLIAKRRDSFKRNQELQERSVLLVQRVWRGRRARQDMLELRQALVRYNAAACRVQRWWQASLRRRADSLLRVARNAKHEHDAAVRLQSAWKRRQGIQAGRMLRMARENAARVVNDAATRVQRRWRARKQHAVARREHEAQMEEIVRAARQMFVAISKVQARVRGQRARRGVAALRLARKKARWKLVEQDSDGPCNFYYVSLATCGSSRLVFNPHVVNRTPKQVKSGFENPRTC